MPKLPRITAPEMLSVLRREGWYVDRQTGGHLQLRHAQRHGTVTVSRHSHAIIKPAVLMSILSQAGLNVDELRRKL
ncbi:MAG: type II toxin-antitoxin system HicA family toxin [Dehalococcoidia bacterium]